MVINEALCFKTCKERILKNMKNKIVDLLSANIEGLEREEILPLVEIPPKTELGDFAFPCFRLAKVYRKAPQMIAQERCV